MLFGVCYLPSFLFLSFILPLRRTFFLCLAPSLFVPLWKQLLFSSATCGQLMAKDISLIHSNDESRWETGALLSLVAAAAEGAVANHFKLYLATNKPTKLCTGQCSAFL
ncbi:hypothetical protein CRENBAI_017910 [Crenichthys baileyi]|uniref:Secreted protein n=1 Tax=Crenichthys baileyi TaxID=28760 RepID=A0AAV9SK91_9TELE